MRVSVDSDSESVGKKIREAELYKVPYTVVIGEKEVDTGKLKPRIRGDMKNGETEVECSVEEFLNSLKSEAEKRTTKSTL